LKTDINLTSEIGPFFYLVKDNIKIQIHQTLISSIREIELQKLLMKKFNLFDLKLNFFSKDEQLYLELESNAIIPEKNKIRDYLKFTISRYIYKNLKNKYTDRKIIYITKELDIPLIGSIYFGIIDRGTNLLQIRPITGCILNCPFCSVDEGPYSKTRKIDYIIEPDYIFEETKKIIDYKNCDDIELHLDGQCEPLIYPYMTELIKRFSEINQVAVISIQTNGVLLTEKRIKELKHAGLTRINLSINSLDIKQAKYLAGTKDYDVNKIINKIDMIKDNELDLLIAPVIIPGINEDQVEPLINLILDKDLRSTWPIIGFQKYIPYQFGRKMNVESIKFNQFNRELKNLEKKYDTRLLLAPKDFNIHKTKSLVNPIRKKSVIEVEIVLPGRIYVDKNRREMIGKAKNRIVHIINCNFKVGDTEKVNIFRTKHNINYGKPIH
jgi:hypothetical protein